MIKSLPAGRHGKIQMPSGVGHWSLVIGICLFLVSCFLVIPALAIPQRIVSGMPSVTEMLYALELGDRIVGVTTNCNYPPEARKKEKVGGFFLNLEKIVSLKPDLVVMLEDAQKKEIKCFRDYGLPVYTVNPKSVEGVIESLNALGKVTGKEKQARRIEKDMRRRIAAVEKKVLQIWGPQAKRRKALVIVGLNPLIVAGEGTFIDAILKYAGIENVSKGLKAAYPQYSFEKLVTENPQYLIIPKGLVSQKEMQNDSRWESLEAVRNNRILFIDQDILSRPGPRVVSAIEEIAGFVY